MDVVFFFLEFGNLWRSVSRRSEEQRNPLLRLAIFLPQILPPELFSTRGLDATRESVDRSVHRFVQLPLASHSTLYTLHRSYGPCSTSLSPLNFSLSPLISFPPNTYSSPPHSLHFLTSARRSVLICNYFFNEGKISKILSTDTIFKDI